MVNLSIIMNFQLLQRKHAKDRQDHQNLRVKLVPSENQEVMVLVLPSNLLAQISGTGRMMMVFYCTFTTITLDWVPYDVYTNAAIQKAYSSADSHYNLTCPSGSFKVTPTL